MKKEKATLSLEAQRMDARVEYIRKNTLQTSNSAMTNLLSIPPRSNKDVVQILDPRTKCEYSNERNRFEVIGGHILGYGNTEDEAWEDAKYALSIRC